MEMIQISSLMITLDHKDFNKSDTNERWLSEDYTTMPCNVRSETLLCWKDIKGEKG